MICKGGAEDLDPKISWRHLEAKFDATTDLASTPQITSPAQPIYDEQVEPYLR